MIELALLTILGSMFIAIEKPGPALLLMMLIQLLCLFPSKLGVDLNLVYLLVFTIIPSVIVLGVTKRGPARLPSARSTDFVLYVSLILSVSGFYVLNSISELKPVLSVTKQRVTSENLWLISVIFLGAVLGILPKLRRK